ncbi:MAG TPA: ABC transporter permease, partial [Planctomycetota bacterium]|nr:ABC transporter permease [Planctomycetota bacterium]
MITANRTKAQVTTAMFYTVLVCLLLGSCWLFASNLDQLFPKRPAAEQSQLAKWKPAGDSRLQFGGGFWRDPAFWRSVGITVVTATVTMLLAAIIGIPASYALSRYRIPGRSVIDVLFSSVIVLPSSSIGLCLVIMLQQSPLHKLQEALGVRLVYTLPGIIVVQMVLSLAMGMSVWRATFDRVSPRFEHVARSLGSSAWRAFRTVTLPSAKPGIVAGLIVAWTRAAAEFGGILLFCGTFAERPIHSFPWLARVLHIQQADPLSVNMWSQIEYGNVEYGFAVGFTLVLISAASVYTIHKLGGKTYLW